MSANLNREGPPEMLLSGATPDGPSAAPLSESLPEESRTLADLPLGAHLVLRCRKDWRDATIVAVNAEAEQVTLSVRSPTGRTYRLRRPLASALTFDGHVPLLGTGHWRISLARYDSRW